LLKKTITYTNFDGNEVTETHYFHLSKADLIKMEVSRKGGLQAYLEEVVRSQDGKQIIETFEMLIRESYGMRTEDGRFFKNPADANAFMSGEAYSELFMSLVTNADAAAEFVNGIIPSGLEQEAAKIAATAPEEPVEDATGLTKTETPRVLSKQELSVMSAEELQSGLAAGRYKLS